MICFVVHKGDNSYLKTCIQHAKKHNQNLKVVLLGDDKNECFVEQDCFARIDDYRGGCETFDSRYIHLSPNPESYEKFCFERWFIILEYMKRNNVEKAMHIDSDVLLNNVTDEIKNATSQFFYCHDSGHTSFFSLDVLKQFCNYILSCYSDKNVHKLIELYDWRKKNGYLGGVSDMTMILLFSNFYQNSINLASISKNSYYDHNINESDFMEKIDEIKALYYANGNYYVKRTMTGELILANSIHFQGEAKKYMEVVSFPPESIQNIVFDPKFNKWVLIENIRNLRSGKIKKILKRTINKLFRMLGWYDLIIPYKV